MKRALVGYTGFVGSNICAAGDFDGLYNSRNIQDAYGTKPELLIYAGLRAEKYLANTAPEKDMELIVQAEENISRIQPRKLVLISTIDVFRNPSGVDENSEIVTDGLHPYGYDRFVLEQWVREQYPDALIVRLPGLFGWNIKKNFIYDFIHVVPFMLKADKFEELSFREPVLQQCYQLQENGFYRLTATEDEKEALKEVFHRLGFSALNFTDSRSRYQFYDLSRLWSDIQIALDAGLTLFHPATEPVSAAEVYTFLTEESFCNELSGAAPANYDYRTMYAQLFGRKQESGYIMTKEEVMTAIRQFVTESAENGEGRDSN